MLYWILSGLWLSWATIIEMNQVFPTCTKVYLFCLGNIFYFLVIYNRKWGKAKSLFCGLSTVWANVLNLSQPVFCGEIKKKKKSTCYLSTGVQHGGKVFSALIHVHHFWCHDNRPIFKLFTFSWQMEGADSNTLIFFLTIFPLMTNCNMKEKYLVLYHFSSLFKTLSCRLVQ